ncbi:MAG TPA: phage terminase large subunit [Clostridia bacterium]
MDINQKIQKYLKLKKELDLRSVSDKLSKYNTGEKVHKKQLMFHNACARTRFVFGGNRSGKTECGAVETVWTLLGNHPYKPNRPNVSGWAVSLSSQVSRDVAQRKILEYLPKRCIADVVMSSGSKDNYSEGVIDYILVKNVFGGISRLGFKSCDQGREKFQGTSLDFVWIDEEPPKDIYDECRMRLLDKKGYIWVTMTPLKGLNWVYELIFKNQKNDPDLWHIHMEWADNPYLDKAEIERMTRLLDSEELDSRRYGKFSGLGGLVYKEFDTSVHVIEPFSVPVEWYDNISIDPGLNNPLSAHWYAVDYDGNVYVIAEHYQAGKDVKYHADRIKKICADLGWIKDKSGHISALIDSAAAAKTLAGTKSVSELFYDEGIHVNHKVNKDVFSGISRVKYYLKGENGKPKLYVFSHCVNMIKEFLSYRWDAGDMPKKELDHAMDELRYYIMSRPEPPEIKTNKSIITKDKERLIKRLRQGYRM